MLTSAQNNIYYVLTYVSLSISPLASADMSLRAGIIGKMYVIRQIHQNGQILTRTPDTPIPS